MGAFSYRQCFFKLTVKKAKAGESTDMTPQKSRTSPSNTPDQPAAGKGMPAKDPRPQKPMVDRQPDMSDGSAERHLELPSERDQAQDMTPAQPDPRIEQAAKDVKAGRKDTSRAIETDQAYKKL